MNMEYYNSTVEMEKAGTDPEFVVGWQCGYLLNPEREEQRVTEAYEAGYEAGKEKDMEAYKEWTN
ncbi:MAG: Alvin_2107 family globule sulfur oxidation protein [bacterium]